MSAGTSPTSRATRGLVALLSGAGVLHFAWPAPFVSIVPRRLPAKRALVYASGAAELACAGLVARPRTRRMGGAASAVLFVAVFPANVSMALRSGRRPTVYRAVSWLRLPLQVPLVLWALRVAGVPARPIGRAGTARQH
ncbi:DoxX family protein [Nakamurella endophytica]|uniref:Membrane protein n=1 Tax=Nakamurella endophytica TaxID=1748367 RepID=A0A917WA32_9ACTN|nr:hypothetical protein [Nakamurella endophytica]GGL84518.1 membrane protein [Nakamurella endophytica]